jgi:hypothetical protein
MPPGNPAISQLNIHHIVAAQVNACYHVLFGGVPGNNLALRPVFILTGIVPVLVGTTAIIEFHRVSCFYVHDMLL